MGGNDSEGNLIALTAGDHFFAHLLLAKVYGGKMWAAVVAMANLCGEKNSISAKHRAGIKLRVNFSHIRNCLAAHYKKQNSGSKGLISCKVKREFINVSGEIFIGSVMEMTEKIGAKRSSGIWAIVKGSKPNYKGWFTKYSNPLGLQKSQLLSNALSSKIIYTLYHFNGSIWAGTQKDFYKKFGAKLYFQSEVGSVNGWYRKKEQADNHFKRDWRAKNSAARGCISGKNNPKADLTIYLWKKIESGEVVKSTRFDMREKGLTKSGVTSIFSGRQKQTAGWLFLGAVN